MLSFLGTERRIEVLSDTFVLFKVTDSTRVYEDTYELIVGDLSKWMRHTDLVTKRCRIITDLASICTQELVVFPIVPETTIIAMSSDVYTSLPMSTISLRDLQEVKVHRYIYTANILKWMALLPGYFPRESMVPLYMQTIMKGVTRSSYHPSSPTYHPSSPTYHPSSP
jgi:hypothetical protein